MCSSGITPHILKEGLALAWLLGGDLWAAGTSCLIRWSWFAWAVGPARQSMLTVLSGGGLGRTQGLNFWELETEGLGSAMWVLEACRMDP